MTARLAAKVISLPDAVLPGGASDDLSVGPLGRVRRATHHLIEVFFFMRAWNVVVSRSNLDAVSKPLSPYTSMPTFNYGNRFIQADREFTFHALQRSY